MVISMYIINIETQFLFWVLSQLHRFKRQCVENQSAQTNNHVEFISGERKLKLPDEPSEERKRIEKRVGHPMKIRGFWGSNYCSRRRVWVWCVNWVVRSIYVPETWSMKSMNCCGIESVPNLTPLPQRVEP